MPINPNRKGPLISVIMGVYYRRNNLDLLQRSIQSILSQTYHEFELLICDDGSIDTAKEMLDHFAQSNVCIRLIRRGNLFSLPEKLNICLESAQGLLIARMDDDDISHPQRFEKQAAYLEQHPTVDFVGSNVRLLRGEKIWGIRQLPERPQVRDFFFVQPYVHPAIMFRRKVLLTVGGYSEDRYCQKCEDYDLLLRLYEQGYHGVNLQECLLDYTIPDTAKGSRTIGDRWSEAVTRYRRFQSLDLLPGAWPYVVKPLAVGLLPEPVLAFVKNKVYKG